MRRAKERPILFNGEMVRAILDGRKTQSRRIIKPQPSIDAMGNFCWNGICFGQDASGVPRTQAIASPLPSSKTKRTHCPFGKPGGRLWVRETFRYGTFEDCVDCEYGCSKCPATGRPIYAADFCDLEKIEMGPWKPSIHMPRSACRILLEITGVRVERIQDITKADAEAEGFKLPPTESQGDWAVCARTNFRSTWQQLYGDSWDNNDWVWVIDFKVKGRVSRDANEAA